MQTAGGETRRCGTCESNVEQCEPQKSSKLFGRCRVHVACFSLYPLSHTTILCETHPEARADDDESRDAPGLAEAEATFMRWLNIS